MEAKLQRLFYTKGVKSITLLHRAVNRGVGKKKRISLGKIRAWLDQQESVQLLKKAPTVKRSQFKPIVASELNEKWIADLAFTGTISKVRPINVLTIIDVYSRRAWAVPVSKKEGKIVTAAFAKIFKKERPKVLQTDNGGEFVNAFMKKLTKQYNVIHTTVRPADHRSQSLTERLNQSIKLRIAEWVTSNNNKRWHKQLPKFVKEYNNTEHSLLKKKPKDIRDRDADLLALNRKRVLGVKSASKTFKIGDRVRVFERENKKTKISIKSTDIKWTKEIFTINSVRNDSYTIKDSDGNVKKNRRGIDTRFQWYEIQKITGQVKRNPAPVRNRLRKDTERREERRQKRKAAGRTLLKGGKTFEKRSRLRSGKEKEKEIKKEEKEEKKKVVKPKRREKRVVRKPTRRSARIAKRT